MHCSALEGRLFLWTDGETEEFREALKNIGLGKAHLETAYVSIPDAEGRILPTQKSVLPLGVETWRRLWVDWLQPREGLGESAVYWANATLLAWHLMERGAHVPTVLKSRDGLEGRWAARWMGEEYQSFQAMVDRMPDSARALSLKADLLPRSDRATLLNQVVSSVIDTQARRVASSLGQRFPASTIYSKWQSALSHPSALLQGDSGTLERFHQGILGWQQSLDLESRFGYRLAFAVEEPKNESRDGWTIVPLVEDLLDPNVKIEIGRVEEVEMRGGEKAAEAAWRCFEQASVLYPALVSFEDGDGLYLPGERVIDFLSRFAPLLEQSGFHILKPGWWTEGDGLRVAVTGELHSDSAAVDSTNAMSSKVRLDWAALLGDQPVTIEELNELAKHAGEMQQVGGKWMRIDPVSVREAVKFLKGGVKKELSARDALREVLGMGSAGRGLEIREIRTEGWIGDLLQRLREPGEIKELEMPAGLKGELRPYQRRGFSWLNFVTGFGLGACLADDMGLGKSLQLLALLALRRGSGRPTLLICPTSVIGNWEREAAKFFPSLQLMVHHGAARAKGPTFVRAAKRHDLVLSSYSLVHRDIEILKQVPWDGVVLDEAQNIKNFETKQAKAARQIESSYRVALTGTPVENHVGDLYSLMDFLNPGLLGSERDFQQRFFKPIQNHHNERAAKQLKGLTAPFVLRRLKTDKSIISDLPEKMEMKTYCKLTKEQAKLYADVVSGCFGEMDGKSSMERRGLILATISRLKQVCNHPAQILKERTDLAGRSGKLSRLTEMLEEVREAGEKALIFTQFAEMGEILALHCEQVFGKTVSFLHGGTRRLDREKMIADFSKPEGASLFVLSLKAGGTGLNLVAANHVFHFDRWWNPAVENQATDRAFRIGQNKTVQVHKFVCMGTLEERIDQMVEEKKALVSKVVEAGEVWLTELSNQELRELFSLSREAWED
ncbi:DEAD/DEAH box helicase [Bryobacter aggregatus]|uniref:DEAD/DEAH box helicase n=1 Tax=Bryobacter aggregatus TaxID=360054 RepID=UPI000AB2C097|nr:DEAD/DEAH box helicase [Bryobacter aggregatus]